MYQFFGEDESLLGFDIEEAFDFCPRLESIVRDVELSGKQKVLCMLEIRRDLLYHASFKAFEDDECCQWECGQTTLHYEIKWMYSDDFLKKAKKYVNKCAVTV